MEQNIWDAKRIFKIIANVFFYAIIIFLMIFSIANMKVKSEDNLANVFGVGMLSVQSDSMKGTFETGDLLFVNMLDDQDYQNLAEGDIVTYYDVSIKAFNTHRIVAIDYNEQMLITQADYNYNHPNEPTYPDNSVSFDRVIAVYHGSMVAGLGSSLDYLQTPVGFALLIILPVLIVLIFEGVLLARHIMAINREKIEKQYQEEREQTAQSVESERERIRAEILAEMKKEKALHTN